MEKIVAKSLHGKFAKDWKHGDLIKPNELLYTEGGKAVRNGNEEKIMIIPFPDATEKDEWFYIGSEA